MKSCIFFLFNVLTLQNYELSPRQTNIRDKLHIFVMSYVKNEPNIYGEGVIADILDILCEYERRLIRLELRGVMGN